MKVKLLKISFEKWCVHAQSHILENGFYENGFSLKDYHVKFDGDVDVEEDEGIDITLERIFDAFNLGKIDEDLYSSATDIYVLDSGMWYVDEFGFSKVNEEMSA